MPAVTTFSDSTTIQSTDTNVYTLVQQNGGWVVQDDQQPNASGTPSNGQQPSSQPAPGVPGEPAPAVPGQPASPAPVAPVAPISPSSQGTSHNWSGYAATGGSYTSVTGTWTVPQLAPTGAPGVGVPLLVVQALDQSGEGFVFGETSGGDVCAGEHCCRHEASLRCRAFTRAEGEDPPSIRDWTWPHL